LSDVPLRSLTSFSFAAASIAGGKHHDRHGHVKRHVVALSVLAVVLEYDLAIVFDDYGAANHD
jgi:hypothetical protein